MPTLWRMAGLTPIAFAALAAAQPSDVSLRHLHHTAWTTDAVPLLTGAFRIARSRDGYLWLNAPNGILRFDGVRFTLLDSTSSPALKSSRRGSIRPLLADRDGTVWMQRPDHALITYRDGAFAVAVPPDSSLGTELAADGAGRIWLYSLGRGDAFHEIRDGRAVRAHLPSEVSYAGGARIVADTGRGLWVGTQQGLWHVVAGHATRLLIPGATPDVRISPLLQSRDGALWVIGPGVGAGLYRLVGGRAVAVRASDSSDIADAHTAIEDSSGAVWISTRGRGLLRWHANRLEALTKRDGLTDVTVYDVSAGSDGTIFLATASGLDRLRTTPFITLNDADGIHVESPTGIIEDDAGSLWTSGIEPQSVTELRIGKRPDGGDGLRVVPSQLPPADSYTLLGTARGGGVWLGTGAGALVRYRGGRVERWARPHDAPWTVLRFVVESRDGTLWLGGGHLELGVMRDGRLGGAPAAFASSVVEDSRGHIWVADAESVFVYEIDHGNVVRRLGRAEGLVGMVGSLVLERDDVLWAMSDSGLVRIADGKVSRVRGFTMNFVPRYGPNLAIADGFLWLGNDSRVARVPLSAIHAAADGNAVPVVARYFGPDDGLASSRRLPFQLSTILRARDGRLWLATPAGLALFDRAHDIVAPTSDPRVEEISAFGRSFYEDGRASIPANPDRLTIHFTVPNPAVPERTRLQYRLEGVDRDWIDGSVARTATYTQLRPRQYLFRVRAWSGDGTPAAHEATLLFRVEPAWYQLAWLRSVAGLVATLVVVAALTAVYRRRTQIAADRLRIEFDAKLAERTRIARELHDTLLQGFTGLVLQLEGLRQMIGRSSAAASGDELARILAVADTTLLDARHSVWDMRTPGLEENGLARTLESTCRGIAHAESVQLRFDVVGRERRLPLDLEATALQIGREAVRNVIAHAQASVARVELRYEPMKLELAIVDDGVGISRRLLNAASTNGHFGILGMRERAIAVGGTLEIDTTPSGGTRVHVFLPCAHPQVMAPPRRERQIVAD
jgi:signal transduction histidine kinase/ligand-binding sensor domain-containing protein